MELGSVLCGSLDRTRVWGRMDKYKHMAESLHHPVLDRGLTDLSLAKTVRESGGKGERVEGERETGNMKTQVEFLLRCCVSVVLHDGSDMH